MRLDLNDRRLIDRREQSPEEKTLDIAEMALAASALKVASAWRKGEPVELLLAQQERAATLYETAEMDAIAARQAVSA